MSDSQEPRQSPVGWYTDSGGDQRWWNGTAWTERTRPASFSIEGTSAAARLTVDQEPGRGGSPFYTKKWFVGAVAVFVGLGIGVSIAGAGDPTNSDKYKAVASKLADARISLNETKDDLADSQETASKVNAVAAREEQLDAREANLAEAEDQVGTDAAEVLEREQAVGTAEKDIAANTISGEGTYEVGVDMKAGKYKSQSDDQCYWSVNADANGGDIVANGLSSGPQTVTVSDGQYFETTRCGDWVRR